MTFYIARQSAFYCLDVFVIKPTMMLSLGGMITWKGKHQVYRDYHLHDIIPAIDRLILPGKCAQIRVEEDGENRLIIEVIDRDVKCDVEVY